MKEEFNNAQSTVELALLQLQERIKTMPPMDENNGVLKAKYQAIYDAVQRYKTTADQLVEQLKTEYEQLRENYKQEYLKCKERILMLESVCLIHGISDFPAWMQKGKGFLENEAINAQANGFVLFPIQIRENMEHLPKYQQDTIHHFLLQPLAEQENNQFIKFLGEQLANANKRAYQR